MQPFNFPQQACQVGCRFAARSGLQRTRTLPFYQVAFRRYVSQTSTEISAAPEIDFSKDENLRDPDGARIVPASPSYFSSKPKFIDALVQLENLVRKHQTLPVLQPGQAPRIAWRTLEQYRSLIGENVRASRYSKILALLSRLNYIHPGLMPEEVSDTIRQYKRDLDPYLNQQREIVVDEHGRAVGVGRRKSSTAVAYLVEGEGQVLINGKPLSQTFGRIHDRESAIWALKITQRIDKYNLWATVSGGGTTGQAEAITLAVAKALMVHEPQLKAALRRAGCVTRDPRRVERKKPGKLKARKMPAWVKR